MRPFLSGLNFSPYALNSASVMTPTESSSSVTPNNQEAASVSWSPSQSLSSGATGSSIDVEIATRYCYLEKNMYTCPYVVLV